MTYVMWAGQQVLVEDRQRLDFTTTDSTYYGIVSYTHGGGIDRPLIAWRVDEAGDVCGVIPHFNWRGQFTERVEDQVLPGGFVCTSDIPLTSRDFRRLYASYETPETLDPVWFGSLITGSADGTGLQYRRARYYDPLVGQFTQIDPIGMRGGLNLYGYANGDPVNFRDPSGLMAECDPPGTPECPVIVTGDEVTVTVYRDRFFPSDVNCGPGAIFFGGRCESIGRQQGPRVSSVPGGGGGSGTTGPSSPPQSCLAAGLSAVWAFGSDVLVLSGYGLAAKGLGWTVKGIKAGRFSKNPLKVTRAFAGRHAYELALAPHPGTQAGVTAVSRYLGGGIVYGGTSLGMAADTGGGLSKSDLLSLIPGLNTGIAVGRAFGACT